MEGSDTVGQQYERLKPVLDYIEQHYAEEITLPTLAGLICVTPEYFCHLFKKTTGIRPISYVNQVRVNKSKELLLDNVQRGWRILLVKSASNRPATTDPSSRSWNDLHLVISAAAIRSRNILLSASTGFR
ncbi:AraC family transcriptional regulator [Paenibacillus amylolyticus]|nr:AraC family transcriptional regulator [Paenibacillus amylolyticus]